MKKLVTEKNTLRKFMAYFRPMDMGRVSTLQSKANERKRRSRNRCDNSAN